MGVGTRAVLDEVTEDALVVVADNEDLADLRYTCNCGKAVLDNGVACDFEKRLILSAGEDMSCSL